MKTKRPKTPDDSLPVAKTLRVIKPGEEYEHQGQPCIAGRFIIQVLCPYCGGLHFHGLSSEIVIARCKEEAPTTKEPLLRMYRLEGELEGQK